MTTTLKHHNTSPSILLIQFEHPHSEQKQPTTKIKMMLKTIGFAFFMLLVQSAFALDDSDCKCQAPKVDSTSGSNVPVYPWIVSLSKRPETPWAMFPQLFEPGNQSSLSDQFKVNRHLCSGIILNEFWILTAARCVHNVLPEQLSVRLNYDNDLLHMFDQPRIEVERSSFHSQFSEMPFRYVANDMALLKLRQPLEFNEQVQPACLLGLGYKAHGLGLNSTLVTAGWGSSSKVVFNALTEHRSPTNMTRQLKSVQLKDVSDNPASILHPNAVMYLERVNPQQPIVCDGDSGNPVMVDHENRTKVVSIMSYQVPSRSGTYEIEYGSGIYAAARISSYTNWLNLHIAQNYCNV